MELYMTGRIKEMVIIRGVNHYPQDIEFTVQACQPALRHNGGAAFAEIEGDGEERMVIVQEIERTQRRHLDIGDITGLIREAVVTEHEIDPTEGREPKTTTGKIQRALTRARWRAGALGPCEVRIDRNLSAVP
jgi:acyl-CoA synthetase (AMP-forming)/AMP-acid ligase II